MFTLIHGALSIWRGGGTLQIKNTGAWLQGFNGKHVIN